MGSNPTPSVAPAAPYDAGGRAVFRGLTAIRYSTTLSRIPPPGLSRTSTVRFSPPARSMVTLAAVPSHPRLTSDGFRQARTSHVPRVLWQGENDAADYLTLISLLHRKLDECVPTQGGHV